MASLDSKKGRSIQHEVHIATIYDGKRSLSSGAQPTDKGDVRNSYYLIECKMTGGPEQDAERKEKSLDPKRATVLKQFQKITEEAYERGLYPLLALRFWAPESILSDSKGWVDLVVDLASNHAQIYEEACE